MGGHGVGFRQRSERKSKSHRMACVNSRSSTERDLGVLGIWEREQRWRKSNGTLGRSKPERGVSISSDGKESVMIKIMVL